MRNHDQLVAELMRRPGVRKEVERLEHEAQKHHAADPLVTSASDWDDAFTSRSITELRARVTERRASGTNAKSQLDTAQLAPLVYARLASGDFDAVDPNDL